MYTRNNSILLCLSLVVISILEFSTAQQLVPITIKPEDFTFCIISSPINVTLDFQTSKYIVIDQNKFDTATAFKKYYVLNTITERYEMQPLARTEGFFLDNFINDTIYNGYSYQPGANRTCAERIATYMCSYTFVEDGTKPCNELCSSVIDCIPNYTFTNVKITPVLDTCLSDGLSGSGCSAINLLLKLDKWTTKTVEADPFDLYPGGALNGSLLGFGVLIGLLLVIGSMAIIMKVQNKK